MPLCDESAGRGLTDSGRGTRDDGEAALVQIGAHKLSPRSFVAYGSRSRMVARWRIAAGRMPDDP